MDEEIESNESSQEDEIWLLPGCASNSFCCLVCGQQNKCNYINIFQTTTCRQRKFSECLSATLLTNIEPNSSLSQVICESCQYLANRAESLELKLEYVQKKLRSFHYKTLKQMKANGIDLEIVPLESCNSSSESMDYPLEISMILPEPRRKSRKDQLILRTDLSLEPEKPVIVKRKRGRPSLPHEVKAERIPSKKLKVYSTVDKPLTKTAALSLASTHDKHYSPVKSLDTHNASDQSEHQFSHNFKSSIRKMCQDNANDKETIIEETKKTETENKDVQTSVVTKVKQKERSKQVKPMVEWFDSRLSKNLQAQESEVQECNQQKEDKTSVSVAKKEVLQKYKLLEQPKRGNSSTLVLKFRSMKEEEVNYNEAFDSDSGNNEDTKHTDPDYHCNKKTYGYKIKRKRVLGCLASENVDKKKKKKRFKKKGVRPSVDKSKTLLDKENTCQPTQALANDMNQKAEKEKICAATDGNEKKESDDCKSFKNCAKKKYQTTDNTLYKRLKATEQIFNTTLENIANKDSDSSLTTNMIKSSTDCQNEDIVEFNPSFIKNNFTFYEELVFKDEPKDETMGFDSMSLLSNSSLEASKIKIQSENIENGDKYNRDFMISLSITTEPVAQLKEEVLDSMCAKLELMFPSSSRNSYLNNNCNEGQYKTSPHQIWSSDAVKLKTFKCEEVECFCDICGDDFDSIELLKHHIEVDHFSPNY